MQSFVGKTHQVGSSLLYGTSAKEIGTATDQSALRPAVASGNLRRLLPFILGNVGGRGP